MPFGLTNHFLVVHEHVAVVVDPSRGSTRQSPVTHISFIASPHFPSTCAHSATLSISCGIFQFVGFKASAAENSIRKIKPVALSHYTTNTCLWLLLYFFSTFTNINSIFGRYIFFQFTELSAKIKKNIESRCCRPPPRSRMIEKHQVPMHWGPEARFIRDKCSEHVEYLFGNNIGVSDCVWSASRRTENCIVDKSIGLADRVRH